MKEDGSRRFPVEAGMATKVAGKMLGTGGCIFGRCFIFFITLTFFSLCLLSLVGCNSQEASIGGAGQAQDMPLDIRKAEVLKELDRKFENPQAHFELGQIYQAEGLTQKAEYHYNVALSFDPANMQAQVAMVKLFLDSGNTAKGKNYADAYVKDVSGSATQSLRLAAAIG